jgi:hypothetical protein
MTPKEFRKRILNNEKIPKNTTVEGNLDLYRCTSLTALPEGLCVGGYLDLYRCTSLTALPEGLCVGGYLDLIGCTSLTALPKGLCVKGYLGLRRCTSLTALPEGLCVEEYLSLRGCKSLKSLTGIKSVGGTLYVDECFIESYPFEELPLLINLPFTEEIKNIIKKRFQDDSRRIHKKNIK